MSATPTGRLLNAPFRSLVAPVQRERKDNSTFPCALKKHLQCDWLYTSRSRTDPISHRATPIATQLAVPTSSGTGFYVTSNGHVVTNEHVVDGCGRSREHCDNVPAQADLLARDKSNDLALLKVDRRHQTKAPSIRMSIDEWESRLRPLVWLRREAGQPRATSR